MKVIPETCHVH